MGDPQRRSLLGLYALVLVVAAAVNFGLRAAGYELAGRAVGLVALIGVLTHAFIRSGRDTQPARTWAESWRRRHLLLIGLSLAIGFSPLLLPPMLDSGWVLAPILLACVPLAFTPLGRLSSLQPPMPERRAPKPWERDAERRRNDT